MHAEITHAENPNRTTLRTHALSQRAAFLLMGVGFFALAYFAVALSRQPGNLAVLWFANAFAVGILLCRPKSDAPALLATQMLANIGVQVLYGDALPLTTAFAVCNALEVALAAYLLSSFVNAKDALEKPLVFIKGLALGVIIPALIGATMGSALLSAAGLAPFNVVWLGWFLGDVFGYMTMASAVAVFLYHRTVQPIPAPTASELVIMPVLWLLTYALSAHLENADIILITALSVGLYWMHAAVGAVTTLGVGLIMAYVQSAHWAQQADLHITHTLLGEIPPLMGVVTAATLLLIQIKSQRLANERAVLSQQASEAANNELIQAHAEITTESERFRNALSASKLGYFSNPDVNGQKIYWDQRCWDIYGEPAPSPDYLQSPSEFLAKVHPDDHPIVLAPLNQTSDITEQIYTARLVNTSGRVTHVKVFRRFVMNEAGVVTGASGFIEDITEEVHQQAELFNTQQSLHAVLNGQDGCVALCTVDRKIILCNIPYARLFDRKPEEMIGRYLREFEGEEIAAQRESYMPEVLSGKRINFSGLLPAINDKPRHVRITYSPIRESNGEILTYVSTLIDVTELENALKAAQAADVAKTRFLSNMSHEMRTPLNGLLGYAQILEGTAVSDEQASLIQRMRAAGNATLALINDVLDYSKLQDGQFQLNQGALWLSMVMKESLDVIAPQADQKGLALRVGEVDTAINHAWLGDAQRMRQVLINLLSNAVKFTQAGSVSLKVHQQGEFIVFEVTDTGMGISAENLAKLFQRFSQVDDSATRQAQGTGLGLAISKDLAQAMGGDLSVQSEWGKGSTFIFRVKLMPIAHTDLTQSVTTAKRQTQLKQDALMKGCDRCNVLIVDDSEMNLDVASSILSKLGATVHTAHNGQEAINWITSHADELDVVLMDIHMPVLDGIEATKVLRMEDKFSRIPIIGLSAGATQQDRDDALNAGMNDYVVKPFDAAQLVNVTRAQVLAYRGHALSSTEASPGPNVVASEWVRIEGINEADAKHRMGNDWPMFVKQLKRLVDEFGHLSTQQLHNEWQVNPEAVKNLIHKLKGNSGLVSADALHETVTAAYVKIKAAQTGDDVDHEFTAIASAMAKLVKTSEAVLKQASANMARLSAETPTQAWDQAVYDELIELIHDQAFSARHHFMAAKPKLAAKLSAQTLQELESLIEQLDYEGALNLLSDQA